MNHLTKDRLAAISGLPAEVQDYALVDWKTVAALLNARDVEHARKTVIEAGLPLVCISERRRLPRCGSLREFIKSREVRS